MSWKCDPFTCASGGLLVHLMATKGLPSRPEKDAIPRRIIHRARFGLSSLVEQAAMAYLLRLVNTLWTFLRL